MEYYLSIDIGASSGRHMLGHLENGKMMLEEIHRFDNGLQDKSGQLCWDLEYLFTEIKTGMKKCKKLGKIPNSIGIDTWAVDFVLLDEENNLLGNTVGYRDNRTQGMDKEVYKLISEDELYKETGIQKQIFNTIYQLMAVKENTQYMESAKTFLMVPDYLHYLLSGVKKAEYTNATTTQLVNAHTGQWDHKIIDTLGFPITMFPEIVKAGTIIGELTLEIQKEIGYNCKVIMPATHDTGSAVAAVPTNQERVLYISSGTWSLMGIERLEADCSKKSQSHNFTNEGGYLKRFRFLKNIMGLWMIQSVKKELNHKFSFAQLCEMASKEIISSMVDCNDSRFLAPDSMINEVQNACTKLGQVSPVTPGEIAAVIYNSLAHCYAKTLNEIQSLTGYEFDTIHVVGGGANADYLNLLTAKYTGKKVLAGPAEATAIGNLMVQMIAQDEFKDLGEARLCVLNSFDIKEFKDGN